MLVLSFTPTSPRFTTIEENDTTVDDRTRLNLHRKLEAVLGPQEADTLMAHLPPVTWQDVATKDDLRVLGADLRTEISQAMERQVRWMVTFDTALAAIALAAARLLF